MTHPFHPLLGQRLRVLFERRYEASGVAFSCEGDPLGTAMLPADWTDRGRPAGGHALGYEELVELAAWARLRCCAPWRHAGSSDVAWCVMSSCSRNGVRVPQLFCSRNLVPQGESFVLRGGDQGLLDPVDVAGPRGWWRPRGPVAAFGRARRGRRPRAGAGRAWWAGRRCGCCARPWWCATRWPSWSAGTGSCARSRTPTAR